MPDRIGDAAVGVIGTLALGILAWARARRRDEADTRAVLSADNREWAEMFNARLEKTDAKLAAVEAERAAERKAADEEIKAERDAHAVTRDRLAKAEIEIAMLKRDVADLKRAIRAMGGTPPGETDQIPAVPAVKPAPEGGA